MKSPGDYLTARLIDQSVIIIRGHDGTLGGFHNVCRHRGHELLQGSGKVSAITCPYHAWAYRLDGSLRSARGSETTIGFDVDAVRLQPVQVEVVADLFVFFNLDVSAQPLSPQIQDFIADIKREIPDFDKLVRIDQPKVIKEIDPEERMYPVQANWKVVMENFLECYHCRGGHPTFVKDLILDDLTYEGHALWAKQRSGTRRATGGEQIFWTLFPTLTFSLATGEAPRLFVFDFAVPDGPSRTLPGLFQTYRLVGDEHGKSFEPEWGPLGREDRKLCESVQRGMASISYRQGRFMYEPKQGEKKPASHESDRYLGILGI